MRVTHVITRLIVGGAQENTVASVLGLAGKPGLEVDLISGPTRGPEGSLEGRFAGTRLLRIAPQLVRAINPWRDFLAQRWLERRFRETPPDIVHTHSGKAGIWPPGGVAGGCPDHHPYHSRTQFRAVSGAAANFVFRAAERRAARRTTMFVTVADAMTRQYLAAGIGELAVTGVCSAVLTWRLSPGE